MYKQRIVVVVVDKVPPRPPMPRDLAPPRPPPPETDTEDEEAFPTPQANQPIMVKTRPARNLKACSHRAKAEAKAKMIKERNKIAFQ